MKCYSPGDYVGRVMVAPFAGAWIEINFGQYIILSVFMSLPSRERGLKYHLGVYYTSVYHVAPFAGAWIEIDQDPETIHACLTSLPSRERGLKYRKLLSSFGGTRSLPSRERGLKCTRGTREPGSRSSLPSRERGLKSTGNIFGVFAYESLPSRERGLKFLAEIAHIQNAVVAPFAGAWIEIPQPPTLLELLNSRSLRGSVD